MKKLKLLSAALLTGTAVFVASCGTGGDSVSSVENGGSVGTASLKISVKFPEKTIAPQFISTRIRCVTVEYHSKSGMLKHVSLTPASPTASLNDLIPGEAFISVVSTDNDTVDEEGYCIGNRLDHVNIRAYLKEGANQLTTTLIAPAKWVFVDDNDNPAPIVFNKLKTDSTETVTDFNLISDYSDYGYNPEPMSLDFTKPSGTSGYKVIFRGNDLTVDNDEDFVCKEAGNDVVCETYGRYFNQFIGLNNSMNAFETSPVGLAPVVEGNDQYNRFFLILGTKPVYEGYYGMVNPDEGYLETFEAFQADNTDVIQDLESRFAYTYVKNANHMEGTILEVVEKGKTEDIGCSYDRAGTDTFDCPPNVADYIDNYIGPTSINIENSSGIQTLALDNDGCYKDVNIVEKYGRKISYFDIPCEPDNDGKYTVCDYNLDGVINDNDDMNGDGVIDANDDYYVYRESITNADICVYPFKAKAEEIPETVLELVIQ